MKFTWDETKRISNINKHGLNFTHAHLIFEADTFTFEDKRMIYQEQRFVTLGSLNGDVVVMVHTETANEIRVISLRKATKNEQKLSTLESDDFDEYPEHAQTDLDSVIHRRQFVEVPQKQSINLMLDADIIAWFKTKSGDMDFQSLINAALRDVISHSS